ncbi:MAG: penicillin-binding protein 2 [Verrucomicrobia bacterium]|jgi:penicillin-binding protein 2|nr:penicillin-binding protein 2 [Verrucomicrobiota bacterium]
MSRRERAERARLRARLILLAMFVGLVFLGVNLWRVQVLRAPEFRSSLDRQSMRRVRLPGVRGRIFDRKGRCLADNRPSYCIAIYTEELRQRGRWSRTIDKVDSVVDELASVLGQPRQVTRDDIAKHVSRRLPLPFLAWRGIQETSLARWAECEQRFSGVDIYVEPVRVYPFAASASHVVGYVGRAEPAKDGEKPYHYYLPEMEGKNGMEKVMDERLRGQCGGRLIRVDASGFKYNETGERDPIAGDDVHLALDMHIQGVAENILSNQPGSVVVLDARNGDVLALASAPAFDAESLKSWRVWQGVRSDPRRPLLNRAIAGRYPPGSTFKPLVAITALESGRITPSTSLNCPGYYQVGNRPIHCWSKRGHGTLQLRKAIEQSCNPFFCDLGIRCEYKRIYHMADSLGFGHRMGIELPGESAGLLPDDEWKRRVMKDAWRAGDTCNVSIGQGALLVTPLQMAVFAAALGNGGYVYRPRLVNHGIPEGDLVNRMAWSAKTMSVVRGGMLDVVQAETGTGKRARIEGVSIGGKTGTAQYGQGKKHAWMIAFAPFDAPRYAIAMVLEDSVSGGITVAPRIRHLLQYMLIRDGTVLPQTVGPEGNVQG